MVLLKTADSALSAAEVISARLPAGTNRTAVRLYTALVGAAVELIRRKGYSPNTTHMTIHAPVEQVARAVGVSRQSAWRHLPTLKALGIVDYRTHKANCRGLVRNSGTVFQVRLNPLSGSRCRLSYQDLKHRWRDLDRDVRQGRTSYRAMKLHTRTDSTKQVDISIITDWSLSLTHSNPGISSVCSKGQRLSLESLLDVQYSRKEDKAKAVDNAAQALSEALADSQSLDFYRRIVWGCLRALQRGLDLFQVVYNMVTRAKVDLQEGFARRAGAILVSRLKDAGLYDELLQV